jgi:replicative DNA helicase
MQFIGDQQTEAIIIGTILMYPETSKDLVGGLDIDDFTKQSHRKIFEIIKGIVANNLSPIHSIIFPPLRNEFDETGKPILECFADMLKNALPLGEAIGAAHYLRQLTARREILATSQQMAEIAVDRQINLAEFGSEALRRIEESLLRVKSQKRSSFAAGEIAETIVEDLKSGKKPDIVPTGLADLDRTLGGFYRRELLVAAGRPSMGKSALLCSIARQSAKLGHSWLIFSLEMVRDQVINRMLSDMVYNRDTPIPYVEIARRRVEGYEIERIERAAQALNELPIEVDDQAGLSASEIASRARRHIEKLEAKGLKLDVLAIDHLGKVRAGDRYTGNKVHETGEKINAFAQLAKELDVAVVCLHQLNRRSDQRDNKRPEMSDLRDSGDVEQDADTVVFPFRVAYYLERSREDDIDREQERIARLTQMQNKIEIIIGKNRNGPCRNLEFYCDMGSNVIRDLA